MVQISDNARGSLLMMGSMTAFTLNDAFMKFAGANLHLFQAVFLRGIGVVIMLVLLCAALGQLHHRFSGKDWALIIARGVCEIAVAYLFISALFNMPIANASAILQALPLTVSLAAALFLDEALGWRRITAIVVGFIGVLMIIQPGTAGFNSYSLWALASVGFITLRDLAARKMSREVPSTMAALVAAAMITIAAGIAAVFAPWSPLTASDGIALGGAALFIIGGYVFSVAAMRVGDVSAVAPFRYTSLLVALVIGVVVFGDWPNGLALAGAALVVGTGLFTIYREGRARKARPAEVFE